MGGDVVWGVMYMMAVLLTGTGWIIYYILRMAYIETRDGESTVTYPIIGPVVLESSAETEPTVTEVEPRSVVSATT